MYMQDVYLSAGTDKTRGATAQQKGVSGRGS